MTIQGWSRRTWPPPSRRGRDGGLRAPSLLPRGEVWAGRLELFWQSFFRVFWDRLRTGSVLVFDDTQAAQSSAFATALRKAIEEAPVGSHVLVLGHRDPPTDWLELVSAGRLATVDGASLAFTPQEARELIGAKGDDESLAAVYADTGGWAAGLVLLGRTGVATRQAPEAMRDDLLEYLALRFVNPLPLRQRELLAMLSWLPQFGADACAAFSDDAEAVAWIRDLQRRHLFITLLATRPPMWRLHDLFRAALRVVFDQMGDAAWRHAAQLRVADFALHCGYLETAVSVFVRAGDVSSAMHGCIGQAAGLLRARREGELLQAARLLPPALAASEPAMQEVIGRAMARRTSGTALTHFERAYVGFVSRNDKERALVTCATALGTMISGWSVFHGRELWQSRMSELMALGLRPTSATERLRVAFVWLRANEVSFSFAADDARARDAVASIIETLAAGTEAPNGDQSIEANDAVEAGIALIEFSSRGGDRELLERSVDLSLPWLASNELSAGALAGWYIALAAVAPRMPVRRHGVLEGDAVQLFEHAVDIARSNAIDALAYAALSYLVASMFSRGDIAAAEKYLRSMREVTDTRLPTQRAGLLQFEARQLLLAGKPQQALVASDLALEAARDGEFPPAERWIFDLQRVQVLIALGRENEARSVALAHGGAAVGGRTVTGDTRRHGAARRADPPATSTRHGLARARADAQP